MPQYLARDSPLMKCLMLIQTEPLRTAKTKDWGLRADQ